jgi:hypothetical protein
VEWNGWPPLKHKTTMQVSCLVSEEILCQNDDADRSNHSSASVRRWKTAELLAGVRVSSQLGVSPRDFWRAQRRRSSCRCQVVCCAVRSDGDSGHRIQFDSASIHADVYVSLDTNTHSPNPHPHERVGLGTKFFTQ